jgi:hypothetical protein
MPASASHPFVIEAQRPLSQSRLWEYKRQLYFEQGVRAWREGGVPHFITSNCFVARSYARVALAHLRSALAGNAAARQKGARILELGAGTGRFAFHFVEQFFPMLRESDLADVPVTYVLTDLAPRNVDFWRAHPRFAGYVEHGHVLFETCDAEDPADVQRVLEAAAPSRRRGPLVVIANYVLDGLRPDLFYCERGLAYEGLVALKAERPEVDPRDPLATLALEIGRRLLEQPPFEDPIWNGILDGYRTRGAAGAVLFPSGVLRCLDRLRADAPESLLVLAADQGSHRADVATASEMQFLTNGDVLLPEVPVNFHAIGEYTTAHGGQAVFANHELGGLCVAALAWDATGRDSGATRHAFLESVDFFGPAEIFVLAKSLERVKGQLTCQEMLTHLRWGAWDAKVLHVLLENLRERLGAASQSEIAAWREAFERVWSLYYHLDGDQGDFAFGIGAALAGVGEWKGAATFFERSRSVWGDDGNTLYNLGVCHARLGDRRAALACIDGVLAAAPGHERALRMKSELVAAAREFGPGAS